MARWRVVIGGGLASLVAMAGCVMARPARTAPLPVPDGLDVRAVHFASASGSVVRGWLVPGLVGQGAVLLLHGVGDNRTSMVERARFLKQLGFTVLLPDFQAHGESTGEHITFGALESLDVAAALDLLRSCGSGERVGLIGVSMGGAAALLGPGPVRADAMVLESVYPTIRQAVEDRLRKWMWPFGALNRAVAPLLIRGVSAEIGVSEDSLRPIDQIGRVRAPMLMLAGERDPYTPVDESRALFAQAPEPKSLWVVDGAGHEDLHRFARAAYEQRVGEFLVLHLRRGAVVTSTRGDAVAQGPMCTAAESG